MLYKSEFLSPLGKVLLLSDDEYVLGVWFEDQKYYGAKYNLNEASTRKVKPLKLAEAWLKSFFNKKVPAVEEVPLKPEVTVFRKNVLTKLEQIPYGRVASYKDIAQMLDTDSQTGSFARAVGGAVGHNPISIIIPCHRVIGSNGSLTGYAGGIERKIALLNLEGINHLQVADYRIKKCWNIEGMLGGVFL